MRFAIALLLVATAQLALGDWEVVRQNDEPLALAGAIHRHIDLADAAHNGDAVVDLALFPAKSCRLRVLDNERGADLAPTARQSDCVAAVNGGYFDTHFAPIGLRMIDGLTTSKLKHGQLMSGVAASNGAVQIVRLNEFAAGKKYDGAIECGPFLVDGGKPVRGLEATRQARRTFIGTAPDDRVALGVCSEVSLAQTGQILAALKFRRALNFDGGSSTGFWCKRADGSPFSIREYKNVRDFVGISAK